MFPIGTTVIFRMKRCACVGGGITEMDGTIIGITPADAYGGWFQVSSSQGVHYIRDHDVVRVLSTPA